METHSVKETHALASDFLRGLKPGESARAVGLLGDLGSGKTTFVQGAAQSLGIPERITSPTFVILKRYALNTQRFENFYHVDAYRLEDPIGLLKLGWEEITDNPGNLVFIEWPERIQEIIPENAQIITFTFVDEITRKIDFPET